jgi:anti-sigma factor ChrR (cupin superfamily)
MTERTTLKQHPPADDLPAFALGALQATEACKIDEHLLVCPRCREEVAAFRAIACTLCYAAPLQEPPGHIKQRLLARVAAASCCDTT